MYGSDPYEYKDFYGEQGDGEPVILEMLVLDPETVINKLREISESDYEERASAHYPEDLLLLCFHINKCMLCEMDT